MDLEVDVVILGCPGQSLVVRKKFEIIIIMDSIKVLIS